MSGHEPGGFRVRSCPEDDPSSVIRIEVSYTEEATSETVGRQLASAMAHAYAELHKRLK